MKKGKDKNNYAIETEKLTIEKNNSTIVNNISLSIKKGEILYIIGPNGGGKTTFIRALLGLEKYSGKIRIFGKLRENLNRDELNKIGYVPQAKNVNFDFPITIEEVINYLHDHPGFEKTLKKFGLFEIRKKTISELSGGQLQRVFIARALINDPEIIIFDEPDTALDSTWRAMLYRTINELKSKKKTILIVTHDLTIMTEKSSKILCLNKTMHLHGLRDEIVTKSNMEKIYGCPVELIAHGKIPHRVLERHEDE